MTRCRLDRRRLLAAAGAACLAGCGRRDGARVINIAGTSAPNTPGERIWLDFKRRAETASGGRMELRPFIYGQLGSEEQLLSGIRRGRIQFANLSAQVASTLVPELSLLYAPYLFDDEAEADFIYDGYLTELYRQLLAARGLHLVTWYEIGFHSVYGIEPILAPADAAGRRFRVSSNLTARLFAEALGADVIPLGFGDIVPSLQTGLIEAGENSVSLYARTGIAAEAPHLTLTRHAFGVSVIVTDADWWAGLPEADRRILAEAFPSIQASRRSVRAQDELDLANPALGIVVHRLDAATRAAWRAATVGVTAELVSALGGRSAEILALIDAAKQEWARLQRDGTSTAVPASRPSRNASRASFARSSG